MIDLLIRSILASALGVVALLAARKASASVRHLLAVAGLAAALAVPLLSALLPPVALPVLPAPKPDLLSVATPAPASPFVAPVNVTFASAPAESPTEFPWSLAWASVSLLLLARSASRWGWLRRRLRHAIPIEGLPCPTPVLESDAFGTPMVAWTGRTVVVLPKSWREWPAERLDVVLRHEMAHVRRGDGWSLLLARLACAAMWPNPLVWLLAREENRLAERAADDFVIQGDIPAWAYAQQLLAIAQEPTATRPPPALGMAAKAEVARRVEMILSPKTPRTLVKPRARLAVIAAALVAAVPVATWALGPQTQATKPTPGFSATLATVAPSPDFLLRCKLVKRKTRWMVTSVDSPTEPQIGQSDASRVVVIPDATTANGAPVTLNVRADDAHIRVSLTPYTDLLNPPSLKVESVVPFKGAGLSFNKAEYRVRPKAWVRYSVANLQNVGTSREVTAYGDYELLVQLVPLKAVSGYRGPIQVSPPSTPRPRAAESPLVSRQGTRPVGRVTSADADLVMNPQQILLKCKVIRSADPGKKAVSTSAVEPTISGNDPQYVVTAPIIRTLTNQAATIVTTMRETRYMVNLTPGALKNGLCRLAIEAGVILGDKKQKRAKATVSVRANEWVCLRLVDADGKYAGYMMEVQFVPVKEG